MTKAIKTFAPQIVSANDLFLGDVVYLTPNQGWTREITDAAIANTKAEAEALMDTAIAQHHQVIGPYLVEVAPGAHFRPIHFRERYRDQGPSNRPDLGRQAERA